MAFFHDTVAEYTWARDVAGLAATTLRQVVQPITEVCDCYDTVPWRLTSRQVDCCFAGPGKRAHRTIRQKRGARGSGPLTDQSPLKTGH